MDQTKRYQIESTANSLLGENKEKTIETKFDNISFDLSKNIHSNLKIIFENKDITQKEIADHLNIKGSVVSFYKTRITPPADKLIKLSELFNISIHALATGEKLNFNFENKGLKEAILRADKYLSLEQHKFLIELMEAIIKNSN